MGLWRRRDSWPAAFWILLLSASVGLAQEDGPADGAHSGARREDSATSSAPADGADVRRCRKLSTSCHVAVRGAGRSNAGFVVGSEAVLVVDCFDSVEHARLLLEEIAAVTDRPVRYVVHTHAHYDHTVGNQVMPEQAEILASQGAARQLFERLEKDRVMLGPAGGGTHGSLRIAEVRPATETVLARREVDLGGVRVELLVAGDCHARGDLVVHVPSEKVLFAGDLAWNGLHPNLSGGSTFRWIGALAQLERLEPEHVVPGHGDAGGVELLGQQRHYLMTLRRLVKHLARKQVPVETIVSQLEVPEAFRDYGFLPWWSRNVGFVHGELMANR